jgi:hypothetical protein
MYLTKSRFKIGISCPTKLYYESNPQQFNKEMTKKSDKFDRKVRNKNKYFIPLYLNRDYENISKREFF